MRELLIAGGIDFIISLTLVLLKIFGILLWSWEMVLIAILLLIPTLVVIVIIIIMIIIYNNTK